MNIPYLDLSPQIKALHSDVMVEVQALMESGQFILGEAVSSCEKELADFTGAPYCVTAGSGTDALVMALMASGVEAGDEVITTGFSFFATAEAIALVGARPVFVDIDPVTYNIDVAQIESAISPKTKAIMPVSLYGQVANMDEISEISGRRDLFVIEDSAQSFGAKYKDRRSGNFGRFSCTSFFPAKPLGCYGDGGAVFCQSPEDAELLQQIRNHGQESRYYHTRLGINGRMDALQCKILSVKLKRYPWEIQQRQRIAIAYNSAFQELDHLKSPQLGESRESVWAQYTLASSRREKLISKLKEKGVPTSIHYPMGLHQQPAMKAYDPVSSLPHVEQAGREVFSLPLYADMPEDHVQYVTEQVVVACREL